MVVAATGFFDGVHQGHRAVLQTLCSLASNRVQKSAVVSFWPHPRTVLQQDAYSLRLLNTLEEKRRIILSLGVDYFYVVPFTKEFSHLSAQEFIREYLVSQYHVSALVIGYDHRLGSSVGQTQEELSLVAASCGVEVIKTSEVLLGNEGVSSTKIRQCIVDGNLSEAASMLGYRYTMHGVVVVGNRIGRTMGYPTANMQLYEPLKLVPGNGVYCVEVEVLGKNYRGICNIGNRPTIGSGNARTIETHILDFDEEIYGLDMKISFLEKIRDEHKFISTQELSLQIARDEEYARTVAFS